MKALMNSQLVRFVLSALLSVSAGILAVNAVALQHDWGFEFVRAIVGQAEHSGQWLGAILIQNGLVSPIAAGLTFGYLRGLFRGRVLWIIFAFVVPMWYYLFVYFLANASGASNDLPLSELVESPEMLLPVGLSLLIFHLFNALGGWIYSQLCRRTRLLRILAPGLLALTVISIFKISTQSLHDMKFLWILEGAFDLTALVIASAFAVYNCGRRSKTAAALCAFFCMMPFLLFDFCNLAFTMSPLGVACNIAGGGFFNPDFDFSQVDRDGFRSLISSVSIFCAHILACALGTCIGYRKGRF